MRWAVERASGLIYIIRESAKFIVKIWSYLEDVDQKELGFNQLNLRECVWYVML